MLLGSIALKAVRSGGQKAGVPTPLITLSTPHISGQNHFPHQTISFVPLVLPPYFQPSFPFSWRFRASACAARFTTCRSLWLGADHWGKGCCIERAGVQLVLAKAHPRSRENLRWQPHASSGARPDFSGAAETSSLNVFKYFSNFSLYTYLASEPDLLFSRITVKNRSMIFG